MIDNELNIFDAVCTGCSACTEACTTLDENGVKPICLVVNEHGLRVPRINVYTCTHCLLCSKACPTHDNIFRNDSSFERYKEKISDCYYGYSLDREHRYEAATAGIATEIAAWMLDTGQADGVVGSYQNSENVVVTEIFTDGGVLKEKARGSIYRQVSVLNGLVEKIKQGKHRKVVLIGLPCHIAGLKKLQKINNYLRTHVEFVTIALFCKQTKTEDFSRIERKLLGAEANQVLTYRGNGWPGSTRVEGGKSLPFRHQLFRLMWGSFAFTPDYCFACSDPLGTVADISVGDAWLRKYNDDKVGSSLFIAYTSRGKTIIDAMTVEGRIHSEREKADNVIASQNLYHIQFKTSHVGYRVSGFTGIDTGCESCAECMRLIKYILIKKMIVEKNIETDAVRYVPEIVLKIYGKVSAITSAKRYKKFFYS